MYTVDDFIRKIKRCLLPNSDMINHEIYSRNIPVLIYIIEKEIYDRTTNTRYREEFYMRICDYIPEMRAFLIDRLKYIPSDASTREIISRSRFSKEPEYNTVNFAFKNDLADVLFTLMETVPGLRELPLIYDSMLFLDFLIVYDISGPNLELRLAASSSDQRINLYISQYSNREYNKLEYYRAFNFVAAKWLYDRGITDIRELKPETLKPGIFNSGNSILARSEDNRQRIQKLIDYIVKQHKSRKLRERILLHTVELLPEFSNLAPALGDLALVLANNRDNAELMHKAVLNRPSLICFASLRCGCTVLMRERQTDLFLYCKPEVVQRVRAIARMNVAGSLNLPNDIIEIIFDFI